MLFKGRAWHRGPRKPPPQPKRNPTTRKARAERADVPRLPFDDEPLF
jgi:hypothetical protein